MQECLEGIVFELKRISVAIKLIHFKRRPICGILKLQLKFLPSALHPTTLIGEILAREITTNFREWPHFVNKENIGDNVVISAKKSPHLTEEIKVKKNSQINFHMSRHFCKFLQLRYWRK